MDKPDDLKAELATMAKIAQLLHALPSPDSLVRVVAWLQAVTGPDMWRKGPAPEDSPGKPLCG